MPLLEEIYGLVIEFGTNSTRAGFIGDDRPRVVIPSAYTSPGKKAGDLNLLAREESKEITRVIEDSEIKDWEGLEILWNEAVLKRLGLGAADAELPPLLLVESPVLWSQSTREKLCQVAFEKFKVPALFMGKAPVLTVFESGRHTGLVVDIGAGAVSITPVFDGYVLKGSTVVQRGFGGDWLSRQLQLALESDLKIDMAREFRSTPEIVSKQHAPLAEPSVHELSKSSFTPSYLKYHRSRLLDDLKESIVQASETAFNPADLALRPPRYFEFPSGYNRNFVLERFRIGELLFDPKKFAYSDPESGAVSGQELMGLAEMAAKAVGMCDVDMRGALVGNIIVCGGGALLSGISERINTEFAKLSNFVHTFYSFTFF